jgi:VanZ family protein
MNLYHRILHALLAARKAWRWLTVLLVLAVCWLAFAPSEDVPTAFWDKANHALAFAAMSISARFAFPRHFWSSMLGLAAFGFGIEMVQFFLPGRNSEWFDVLSDFVGIALGAGVAALVRRSDEKA